MKLDIRELDSRREIPFFAEYDLSALDFYGSKPIREPLRFNGEVRKQGGGVLLDGELATVMHLHCDRCGKPFTREKTVPVSKWLALSLENDDNDDITICPGGICDLEAIATEEWILEMDMQNLCEDCAD